MDAAETRLQFIRELRKIAARIRAASLRFCLAFLMLGAIGVAAHGQPRPGVSVSGDQLLLNGRAWIPKGFTWVGYVAPPHSLSGAEYLHAHATDGDALLQQARSFGANTIRIQVSQPGLDPSSSIYDPSYAGQIVAAVRHIRQSGFVVIVSMQWERPSGLQGQPNMPSSDTQRAWRPLFRALGSYPAVMLELFNEPAKWANDPAGWPTWQKGMQALVNEARANGARNVLVLDGLRGAKDFAGAPVIQDPLNQLAYAVHPYISPISPANASPSVWDRNFGDFADTHAVIATEWNELPSFGVCGPSTATYSRGLVSYLAARRIGLILWAQDIPSTILDKAGQPLNFAHFSCGSSDWGAAAVAIRYFRAG